MWRISGNANEPVPTAVVGHNLVFCSAGRNGPTFAIRPGGSGDVSETNVAWKVANGSPFIPSAILNGDYLFFVDDMKCVATCFDASTGKVMWKEILGQPRHESFSASPVTFDGKVFSTNDDGETFVIEAGPEFKLLRIDRLKARVLASPALAGGRWYFRTAKHLVAIGTIDPE